MLKSGKISSKSIKQKGFSLDSDLTLPKIRRNSKNNDVRLGFHCDFCHDFCRDYAEISQRFWRVFVLSPCRFSKLLLFPVFAEISKLCSGTSTYVLSRFYQDSADISPRYISFTHSRSISRN
jgi:hypothetical protein